MPPAASALNVCSLGLSGASAGHIKGNWDALWSAVLRDHYHAGLIWNETTRAELREALQVPALQPARASLLVWGFVGPLLGTRPRCVCVSSAALGRGMVQCVAGRRSRVGARS
jgi:DNAJ protein RME-8 N-terminal